MGKWRGLAALAKGLLSLAAAVFVVCALGTAPAFADAGEKAADLLKNCTTVEYKVANPTIYFPSDEDVEPDTDIDDYALHRLGDRITLRRTSSSDPVVYEHRCMPDGDFLFVNVSDASDWFEADELDSGFAGGEWRYGKNEVELKVGEATCTYTIDIALMDADRYSRVAIELECSEVEVDSYETGEAYYRDDESAWHLDGHAFAIDPYPAFAYSYENFAYDVSYVGYKVKGEPAHELKRNSLGVYVIPPLSGKVTIIVRSELTATVKDGVMTLPASKNLPNAYRLDIDLGKSVDEPSFTFAGPDVRNMAAVYSDYYLGIDYYLWPDCDNYLGFRLKETGITPSLTLAPADAGEVSWTPTIGWDDEGNETEGMLVCIKLTKPATLHVGTDGVILSAKPAKTSYTYTGKPIEPAVKVETDSRALQRGREYSVAYESNVDAGTARATVRGVNGYTGEATFEFTIGKAANAVKTRANVNKKYKASALKKKAATIGLPKATSKFGEVKWSVSAKDKKKVLSFKGGKVKVKKGAKKGTYTLTLEAGAAGTANYAAASKEVTFKVTVR